MYAARRLFVKQCEDTSPAERYSVQITRGGQPAAGIRSDWISVVEEDVMYWRKANHIHGWFVDNVQGYDDDCKDYYVSWDRLRELLEVCEKVLKASKLVDGMVYAGTVYNHEHPDGLVRRTAGKVIEDATVAKKLLPTRKGFFFGNQEYDEDYLNEVVRTRHWAARMIQDHEDGVGWTGENLAGNWYE